MVASSTLWSLNANHYAGQYSIQNVPQKQVGVGAPSYLVTNSAIRHVVPRVDLPDMNHDAHEIVRARSSQLAAFLSIVTLCAIGVRKHVELERETHRSVNLGSPIATALFILESLPGQHRQPSEQDHDIEGPTFNCSERTLGSRLMVVCLWACSAESQL